MQLLQYLIVLIVSTLISMAWLWRKGRGHSRFALALYVLLGLIVVAGGLPFFIVTLPEFVPVLVLTLCWLTVLVGVEFERRWLVLFILANAFLFFIPILPLVDMLGWGLVTAVPLLTINFVQNRRIPIPALVAEDLVPGKMLPVGSQAHVSAEMILSEQPILECLTDGVLVCSTSGLLFSVNQAAIVILGLPEEKLIGRPITEILVHFPQIGTQLDEEERFRTFTMNGRTIQGHMNLIYGAHGHTQGAVFVLRDITAEVQAKQAADSFLTTISYELRTPLTAIKGYIELLEATLGANITDNQLLFMDTIQRNVSRTVQLINSLIFASSVKGGRLDLQPGVANVPQLIRQISREKSGLAAENNQHIVVEIDDRLGHIGMDPIHLSTILEELVSNGIRYGRSGGSVRITAVLESGEFAIVSIMDEGIGIAEADQSRIFEEFFRPEYRNEQIRASGIGMGLSIVRALVEAYNGRIWFTSTPNQGTTFTFIIPVVQPEKPTPLSILKSPVAT